jgi:dTDP-4-dehydrorhamnose 3,5-epimerase
MKVTPTKIEGVYVIETDAFLDDRGVFVKTFHEQTFKEYGMNTHFKESFYSVSKKDVIRGMHFHLPPEDHSKLVYMTRGSVIDVVLDLRKESLTYGAFFTTHMSAENHTMVYIPTGCAHGFLSLEDDSCMIYLQTGMYSPAHDAGIHFDSFGMKWGVTTPIISKRDKEFLPFKDFSTPF